MTELTATLGVALIIAAIVAVGVVLLGRRPR